jgi:hypothetical protein
MNCCGMTFGFWRTDHARDASAIGRDSGPTANSASPDRRIAAVWPEQGERAFGAFLARLGGTRDKADFDRFIAERRSAVNTRG